MFLKGRTFYSYMKWCNFNLCKMGVSTRMLKFLSHLNILPTARVGEPNFFFDSLNYNLFSRFWLGKTCLLKSVELAKLRWGPSTFFISRDFMTMDTINSFSYIFIYNIYIAVCMPLLIDDFFLLLQFRAIY